MVETMNRSKYIAVAAAAAMALTIAGCGFSGDEVVEVTPTPMATPTPTVISITATPLPTSTPAPKMIGKKTAQAKFIYLTNNLQNDIRELYLRISGDDEGDWILLRDRELFPPSRGFRTGAAAVHAARLFSG